jgi:hypothetical protein
VRDTLCEWDLLIHNLYFIQSDIVIYLVCSVDVGSIGRTTYKLLSCDCVRVASQDPEEELAASNFLTIGIRAQVSCSDRRARFCAGYGTIHVYDTIHKYGTVY